MSSCLERGHQFTEEVAVSLLQRPAQQPRDRANASLPLGKLVHPGGLRKCLPPSRLPLSFSSFPPSVQHLCPLANGLPFMKRKKRCLGVIFQTVEAGSLITGKTLSRQAVGIMGAQALLQQQVLDHCLLFIYACPGGLQCVPHTACLLYSGTPHASSCLGTCAPAVPAPG